MANCNKCRNEVVFSNMTTEGYLCFCPVCEEDLDNHEVNLYGVNFLTIKTEANMKGVSVVMDEVGNYFGLHNRVISAVPFDNICEAYYYGNNHIQTKGEP